MIYENSYFKVIQNEKYKYFPGAYEIICKKKKINSLMLAKLEYLLRKILLSNGAELMGVYREEIEEFKVYIIPYYVDVLIDNKISPDLYQPYIKKYLNSYKDEEKTKLLNIIVSNQLEENMGGKL